MEQTPTPGRRLNVLGKAARRKRIFARLREGWAYDEIAGAERVSAERVRQIVAEVLGKRVLDRGVVGGGELAQLLETEPAVGAGARLSRLEELAAEGASDQVGHRRSESITHAPADSGG